MKSIFKRIIRGGEAILLILVAAVFSLPFLIVLVPVKLFRKQPVEAVFFICDLANDIDEFCRSVKETLTAFLQPL